VLLQHGLGHLKQAMVTGQYHNKPSGVFVYAGGGEELESSNAQLYNFTQDRYPRVSCPTCTQPSSLSLDSKTTWINVHTGLGPHASLVPGAMWRR
jgi:hypothetical protein